MRESNLEPIGADEAKELYLRQRENEVSESTIQAHHYRLSHFVKWCDEVEEIDNLNELGGRDLQRYKIWRRDDGNLNNVTMSTQLSTLTVFIRWCESIDAVQEGLNEKILTPKLSPKEDRKTVMLAPEAAEELLTHLRRFEFGTRTHAFIELLWHTGIRIGAAHGIDLDDYSSEMQTIELCHRPESGTRLKNKNEGERFVALSPAVCDILDAYIKVKRKNETDEHGRKPLFTSRAGRPSKTTLRDSLYKITRPCVYSQKCPHDRIPETCEAMEHNKASKCPSNVNPHAIRRGSITHHLSKDVPDTVVSDRMNVSLDVLEKHYDQRGERQKAEQRRQYLSNI
ncbi:tyrosine-type recombinase/integrase [Haloferax volcanii]|uniref:tyrosine-type recombinase/integrase n=1 Tax=Haloferax volcanii TaxID=2246 RepID=UPI0038542772